MPPNDASPQDDPSAVIWQVVSMIPAGSVCSYGQVAALAGLGRGARQVGRVLANLPADTQLPWHRVVNAQGRISLPAGSKSYRTQKARLEAEGIAFQASGRLQSRDYFWNPGKN